MKINTFHRAHRGGFSLLELMLVLAIIGVLTAVAAWNIVGQGDSARRKATIVSMRLIRGALQTYQLNYAAYPAQLGVLQTGANPLLDPLTPLQDGWKRPFLYQSPGANGQPFDLFSQGPDGLFPSADDLSIWTSNAE